MAARRLSLHPSAEEDEHVLFTAGFAYLARVDSTSNDNIAMDWEGSNPSSSPCPPSAAARSFALLRLVLHTQAGSSIYLSLAFVQAPVPDASRPSASAANPFLP
ncbi:hypothetical protein B0H13DRAFT_2318046 [Mycena leptocephala]|nr:hypothetical protein B0H13DRAFT_2318046 [Mycena leptocephala]